MWYNYTIKLCACQPLVTLTKLVTSNYLPGVERYQIGDYDTKEPVTSSYRHQVWYHSPSGQRSDYGKETIDKENPAYDYQLPPPFVSSYHEYVVW